MIINCTSSGSVTTSRFFGMKMVVSAACHRALQLMLITGLSVALGQCEPVRCPQLGPSHDLPAISQHPRTLA